MSTKPRFRFFKNKLFETWLFRAIRAYISDAPDYGIIMDTLAMNTDSEHWTIILNTLKYIDNPDTFLERIE